MHDTRSERMIHETNAGYTNEQTNKQNETNELYGKHKQTNARYMKRTNDTRNERTIHERTNHWSVTINYPIQYSIVLLFE